MKKAIRVVRKLQFQNKFLLKTHFCRALARKNARLEREPMGFPNKSIVFLCVPLLVTACIWDEPKRTIEDVYCWTIERNYSSHNVFMQYYLSDGTITRKKIYKSTENRITSFWHDDYINMNEMYENNYRSGPDYDTELFGTNPNKVIQKILIIDIDTNTILKHLEYTKNWYFLGFAENNWDMRVRWEYWILDITDEWLMD